MQAPSGQAVEFRCQILYSEGPVFGTTDPAIWVLGHFGFVFRSRAEDMSTLLAVFVGGFDPLC